LTICSLRIKWSQRITPHLGGKTPCHARHPELRICRFNQLWKRYKPFPKQDRGGRFVTLASGFEVDREALPIRAEARVLGATLNRDQVLTYDTVSDRFLYLVPSTGSVSVNGVQLDARDGAAIKELRQLTITALRDSEVLLVDAPPRRSVFPKAD